MRVDTALDPSVSSGRLFWSVGAVRTRDASWRQVGPARFETSLGSGMAVAVEFGLSTAGTVQTKVWCGEAVWGYVCDTSRLPGSLRVAVEGLVRALSGLPPTPPKPHRHPWDRLTH